MRRRIPIVVIEGTGGKADEIAVAVRSATKPDAADPLAGILGAADLTIVGLDIEPADFEGTLASFLGPDETLREAWRLQKLVSSAADRQQGGFRGLPEPHSRAGVPDHDTRRHPVGHRRLRSPCDAPAGGEDGAHLPDHRPADHGRRPGRRHGPLPAGHQVDPPPRELRGHQARDLAISRPCRHLQPCEDAVDVARGQAGRSHRIARSAGSCERTSASSHSSPAADCVGRRRQAAAASAERYVDGADRRSDRLLPQEGGGAERRARLLRALAIAFGAVGTFLAAVSLQIWVAVTTSTRRGLHHDRRVTTARDVRDVLQPGSRRPGGHSGAGGSRFAPPEQRGAGDDRPAGGTGRADHAGRAHRAGSRRCRTP